MISFGKKKRKNVAEKKFIEANKYEEANEHLISTEETSGKDLNRNKLGEEKEKGAYDFC